MTIPLQEATGRILVVDDDPVLRAMLQPALEEMGHEVVLAEDGAKALDLLERRCALGNPPDLMVTDIQMPNKTGLELLEEMSSRSIQVPSIAMTAVGDKEMVIQLLRLGVEEFIDKPFTMQEMQSRIGTILRRNRTRAGQAGLEVAFEGRKVRLDRDVNEARRVLEKMRERIDSIEAVDKGRIELPGTIGQVNTAWTMHASREIGGQMIAYQSHPERFELLVAHPSGHDAMAIQLSTMIRLIFNASFTCSTSCEEFLRVLGSILYQQPRQPLVRAILLRMDFVNNTLEAVSAGHPSPILVPGSGAPQVLITTNGNELGPNPAPQLAHSIVEFPPGDRILIPCPWLPLLSRIHAPSGSPIYLGADGLIEFALESRARPLKGMLDSIWDKAMEFTHWNTPEDLLLVGLERRSAT